MPNLIQAGINIFGVKVDPALFAFILIFTAFAVLNYIDKKRID